jgi:hypothetical protein
MAAGNDYGIPKFEAVALKSLTKSETLTYKKTNRNEFLGARKFIDILGELDDSNKRYEFKTTYKYISDSKVLTEIEKTTWYYFNSKKNNKRIYGLYYTRNPVTWTMVENDLLIVGKVNNNELYVILIDKNSTKQYDEFLSQYLGKKPEQVKAKSLWSRLWSDSEEKENEDAVQPTISSSAKGWIRVYFTPGKDCENNIIEQINNSKKKIDVAVYSITNDKIVDSLIAAKKRGVKVRIITDRLQSAGKFSLTGKLADAGFPIKTNIKHKIMHHKFAVFDDKEVESGSYNWTTSATKSNAENCMFFEQGNKEFSGQFDYLWDFYK